MPTNQDHRAPRINNRLGVEFNKVTCAIALQLWIGAALVFRHVEGDWLSALGFGPFLWAAVSAGNGLARTGWRDPYSPPTLDLNHRGPVDPDEIMRRRALIRFRWWRPGPDDTIH
jgi:hypothetical protein